MKTNPVCWFEIYVKDLGRASKFYETVLETSLTKLDAPVPDLEMMAFPMDMEAGGAADALVKKDGFPVGANSTLVYFACENCATEASRVESAGGKIQKEKMSIGQYGISGFAPADFGSGHFESRNDLSTRSIPKLARIINPCRNQS